MASTEMKHYAITGATGMLGRRVVARLARRGDARIYCIARDREHALALFSGFDHVACVDATDASGCDAALDGADVLVHAAFARSQDGQALADSLRYARHVFERARALGTAAIVNVSSQSVYGNDRAAPAREIDAPAPGDRYALAKYASELLLDTIAARGAFHHVQLRLASLIGEGMDERLVTRFVAQAMQGQPIRLQGGTQRFSFLDIEDAADGIARLLALPAARWRAIYNLGPPGSHSLREIAQVVADTVRDAGGPPVAIEFAAQNGGTDALLDATMDSSAFQHDSGFIAPTDLAATLQGILRRRTWITT